MDFEEFRERLMEDLRDNLQHKTGKEFTAEANHVKKLQDAGYDGIVIRPEGESVGVTLDAQEMFKALENGKSYDEVMEHATEIAIHGFENQPAFNIEDFSNYDVMKEKLAIQVVSTERNTEMLEKIPHKEVEDMSMVCRFVVGNNENEMGTVLVTNQMLESYGITGEQLFNDAAKYAPELRPSEIKGMADVLAEMMGVDVSELGETMGIHNVLHQVFQIAVEDDMIRNNPVDNTLRELKQAHGFESEKRKALTVEQERIFLDYLRKTPRYQHWYP